MSIPRTPPLVLVVLLLLCSGTARGIISDVKVTGSSDHTLLGSFGYRVGGTVTVELRDGLEAQADNIECYICSPSEYSKLSTNTFQIDRHTLKEYCSSFKPNTTYKVFEAALYRVYLTYNTGVAGTAHVTFLNPDNEHLSVGYTQLPIIYFLFSAFWGLASASYAIYLCFMSFQRYHNYPVTVIHAMILACAIVRFTYASTTAFMWTSASSRGVYPSWAFYSAAVFCALFETLFFTLIITLSRGWCVMVSPKLEPQSALALGALFITLVFSNMDVSDFAYVVVLIIYFFLVTRILAYCLRNMKLLLSFKELLEHGGLGDLPFAENTAEAVGAKASLFALLRVVGLFTFTAFLLEKSAISVVSYNILWMSTVFFEAYFVLLALSVAYITTPKNHALVFRSVETADFVGPAARMAAHPYEASLDPLPSVFIRDDVEKLISRKRVAVVEVGPFADADGSKKPGSEKPGYVLAVKKHLLCKKTGHRKSKEEKKKRKEEKRKRRKERGERKKDVGNDNEKGLVIDVADDDVNSDVIEVVIKDMNEEEEEEKEEKEEKKYKKNKRQKTKNGFQQIPGSSDDDD